MINNSKLNVTYQVDGTAVSKLTADSLCRLQDNLSKLISSYIYSVPELRDTYVETEDLNNQDE